MRACKLSDTIILSAVLLLAIIVLLWRMLFNRLRSRSTTATGSSLVCYVGVWMCRCVCVCDWKSNTKCHKFSHQSIHHYFLNVFHFNERKDVASEQTHQTHHHPLSKRFNWLAKGILLLLLLAIEVSSAQSWLDDAYLRQEVFREKTKKIQRARSWLHCKWNLCRCFPQRTLIRTNGSEHRFFQVRPRCR